MTTPREHLDLPPLDEIERAREKVENFTRLRRARRTEALAKIKSDVNSFDAPNAGISTPAEVDAAAEATAILRAARKAGVLGRRSRWTPPAPEDY